VAQLPVVAAVVAPQLPDLVDVAQLPVVTAVVTPEKDDLSEIAEFRVVSPVITAEQNDLAELIDLSIVEPIIAPKLQRSHIAASLCDASRTSVPDDIRHDPRFDVRRALVQHGRAAFAPFFHDIVCATITDATGVDGKRHVRYRTSRRIRNWIRHDRPVGARDID
jgi:hypothetical protein